MSNEVTWNERVRHLFVQQFALMVGKQKDYGPNNINAFGEMGVIVRMSDKFERLKNLLFSEDEDGNVIWAGDQGAENESVDDTYMDILNYALIALMVRKGYWNAPFNAVDADLLWRGGGA